MIPSCASLRPTPSLCPSGSWAIGTCLLSNIALSYPGIWCDNTYSSLLIWVWLWCCLFLVFKIHVSDLCWLDFLGAGGLCHSAESWYQYKYIHLVITCDKVCILCLSPVNKDTVELCWIALHLYFVMVHSTVFVELPDICEIRVM
jgi:hypothetical protein